MKIFSSSTQTKYNCGKWPLSSDKTRFSRPGDTGQLPLAPTGMQDTVLGAEGLICQPANLWDQVTKGWLRRSLLWGMRRKRECLPCRRAKSVPGKEDAQHISVSLQGQPGLSFIKPQKDGSTPEFGHPVVLALGRRDCWFRPAQLRKIWSPSLPFFWRCTCRRWKPVATE